MFRVTLHPPRCYLLGHRIHHGLAGLVVGALVVASDWHDRTRWLPDLLAHPAWDHERLPR